MIKTPEDVLILCCIAFLVLYTVFTLIKYRYTRKAQELALLKLQLSLTIDSSISEKIDEFIGECFNDYILLNTEYRQDIYWTQAEEKKLVTEVAELVSTRLSPVMVKQLSVYYNEKAIPDIIGNKIYELVIAYLNTKTNKPREEPDRV